MSYVAPSAQCHSQKEWTKECPKRTEWNGDKMDWYSQVLGTFLKKGTSLITEITSQELETHLCTDRGRLLGSLICIQNPGFSSNFFHVSIQSYLQYKVIFKVSDFFHFLSQHFLWKILNIQHVSTIWIISSVYYYACFATNLSSHQQVIVVCISKFKHHNFPWNTSVRILARTFAYRF